jgi:hypothetical protein
VITGLNKEDAQMLSTLLNAGVLPVSLYVSDRDGVERRN